MRNELIKCLCERFSNNRFVFLTGDLGYNSLEELKSKMGNNFINAGVSEQNMVSVAAALCKEGMETWVYSIAPFLYARAFEQIRNDACFHSIGIKLLGNGGGYTYGVMGPSHHAIEDYGVLLALPNMSVYIPAFSSDIPEIIKTTVDLKTPVYLRIGIDESSNSYNPPKFENWRKLTDGNGVVFIAIGPLASMYVEKFLEIDYEIRPNLWVLSKLPIIKEEIPKLLLDQLKIRNEIFISEEHVKRGGAGMELIYLFKEMKINIVNFQHFYALNHLYDAYGSQTYLRHKSKLDFKSILEAIMNNEYVKKIN